MSPNIAIPDATQFEKKALAVLEVAKSMSILTDEQFQAAGEFLRGLKAHTKELDATFDETIEAAHQAHKKALGAKAKHAEPIKEAERIVKGKVTTYQIEAQRKADEEKRRLEAEAKERAEKEALDAAVRAEASGDKEAAEAIISEPVYTPPVKVQAPVKAAGVSFKDKHDGVVESLMDLVKAVAAGKAPLNLVMADQTAVRKYAEATKGSIPVPGVRFTKTQVAAVRA